MQQDILRLIADYVSVLNDRFRLPVEQANKLVPRQAMLEKAIVSMGGYAPFHSLLQREEIYIGLQAAFVILESDSIGEIRDVALSRMRQIAKEQGNTAFSAHMYLKRKGYLEER